MCHKRLFSITIFVSLLTLGQLYPYPQAGEEEKPVEEERPAEEEKPAEETKPAEEEKPAEETNPAEETKPAEEEKPAKETKPAEEEKPAEETKPAEGEKSAEEAEPDEEAKASETVSESDKTPSTEPASTVTLTIAPDASTLKNAVTDKAGHALKMTEIHDIPIKKGVFLKLVTEDWITYHTQPQTIPGCLCVTRGPLPKFKLYGNIHFPKIKVTPERYVTMPTESTPTICPPCVCPTCTPSDHLRNNLDYYK